MVKALHAVAHLTCNTIHSILWPHDNNLVTYLHAQIAISIKI